MNKYTVNFLKTVFIGVMFFGVVFFVNSTSKKSISSTNELTPSNIPKASESTISVVDTIFYNKIGNAKLREESSDLTEITKKLHAKAVNENFSLEIKVAKSIVEANSIIKMLNKIGIKTYYTAININGRIVYKIRYKIFKKYRNAQKESNYLRAQKQIANKIIKL